ncbi:MAG: hypothetical protein EA381_12200 [Planctomycetaceae bacterium]|nr:MAG: hypothetical protein EA381_12200 [Planctomycetaceae bacterium]
MPAVRLPTGWVVLDLSAGSAFPRVVDRTLNRPPDSTVAVKSRFTRGRTWRRVSSIVLLAMLASYPILLWGVERSLDSMKNSPIRWIPKTSPGVIVFHDFVERFGAHELVLISWDGATVDDPRLATLSNALRESHADQTDDPLFSHVLDGYSELREMLAEVPSMTRRSALLRFRGWLIGADEETTCVIVVLTDRGADQRDESLEMIFMAARDLLGLEREDLYLAGPPIDGYAVDRLSRRSLRLFAIPSAVVSLLFCWVCLRSWWFTVPVILVAAYGQSLCLSMVYFSGGQMNAILIVLPALVFVLAVSGGIHLVNYFNEEVRTDPHGDAVRRALQKALPPSGLAALTTAIGLGSLAVSDVEPVRQFGWLGAGGVLATFSLLFLLLPGLMYRRQAALTFIDERESTGGREEPPPAAFWMWLAVTVAKWKLVISLCGFMALAIAGFGLARLTTTVDVLSLLDDQVREVQDMAWFEQHIGPLVPVELVVHFPTDSPLETLDRLSLINGLHGEMNRIDSLDGTISVATFLPGTVAPQSVRGTIQRTVLRKRIESQKQRLIDSGYLRVDPNGEYWRVGARAYAQEEIDYADLLDTVRGRLEPLVDEARREHGVEIGTTYTGVTSAVYAVQRALLADLFNSFLTAVILVGIVMVVVFRGLWSGLVAMVPNVLPTCVFFGFLGWSGRPVDIGSIMTASVALGIAVDGTFHFVNSCRYELSIGRPLVAAIAQAYQHCGRALLQTTLICALGLAVYVFSSFLPARHFSLTMMVLLMIAVIGDLILLPALLLGPAGGALAKVHPGEDIV